MRLAVAAALAAFALGATACGADDEGAATQTGAQDAIEIVETDFALDPANVTLDAPGTYTFRAVNAGDVEHALEIDGHGLEEETETIAPGESAELTVEITEPGEYELYCPVSNHRELGMEGVVTLGGGAGGAGTDETTTHDTTTDETTTDETTTEDGGGYGYG